MKLNLARSAFESSTQMSTKKALFRTLVTHEDIINGDYDIHWLESLLAETEIEQ